MKYLYAVLIAVALISLYGWLYIQNHKTPVPEGCESLKPDCGACGIKNCSVRKKYEGVTDHGNS